MDIKETGWDCILQTQDKVHCNGPQCFLNDAKFWTPDPEEQDENAGGQSVEENVSI